MRAILPTRYGPPEVLQMVERPDPTPGPGELLIRMHATTVSLGDCEIRGMFLGLLWRVPLRLWLGWRAPRRPLGTDLSGVVEAVGEGVTGFARGDAVFGSTGMSFGTNAERVCVPEEGAVIAKPGSLTHVEAATFPFGGRDGLHFIRASQLQEGQSILINGAGGSIGTFALQLARLQGARVTAVDRADKLELLRGLGAERVIDYEQEDFTRGTETYDVVLDVVGKAPYRRALGRVKPGGRLVLANPSPLQMLRAPLTSLLSGKRVFARVADGTVADLVHLRDLHARRKLKAVIDRSYDFEELVEAHRYVETGAKAGSLVITFGPEDDPPNRDRPDLA